MKPSSVKIAAYLLLVFASGIAVGAFSQHLYTARAVSARTTHPRSPEEYRKRYLGEMQTRLKLDDGQTSKLNSILDETRNRFDELRERSKPDMDVIQKDQIKQINGILTESQQAEYEKYRKEREASRKKDRPSPPGL
jgi:Spy/CpxP family protein refolding chaperone